MAKGKVSKNQQTDRKVQEGSKDNVKVITTFKTAKGNHRFKAAVMHKNKVAEYLAANS